MKKIYVSIREKTATYTSAEAIVCGNSDYVVHFDFDSEWEGEKVKTARFIYNRKYVDVVFSGSDCPVPVLTGTKVVAVGVYAGDLMTTTPVFISCKAAITDENGTPDAPDESVYNQIIELVESGMLKGDKGEKGDKGDAGISTSLRSAIKTFFINMQVLLPQLSYITESNLGNTLIQNAKDIVAALDSEPIAPEVGILQNGSVLTIINGVTANQNNSILLLT